jgi:hypothetical protein
MVRLSFVPHVRASWSSEEIRRLRELAGDGLGVDAISAILRKTPSAIRNKASMHGISLRASIRNRLGRRTATEPSICRGAQDAAMALSINIDGP